MRRGERQAWREVAAASGKVAASTDWAEEYVAKVALRASWAKLHGIYGVIGLPRPGGPT